MPRALDIIFDVVLNRAKECSACSVEIHDTKIKINLADQRQMAIYFRTKLWYCVSGRVKQNLILSNELIKVELPP